MGRRGGARKKMEEMGMRGEGGRGASRKGIYDGQEAEAPPRPSSVNRRGMGRLLVVVMVPVPALGTLRLLARKLVRHDCVHLKITGAKGPFQGGGRKAAKASVSHRAPGGVALASQDGFP